MEYKTKKPYRWWVKLIVWKDKNRQISGKIDQGGKKAQLRLGIKRGHEKSDTSEF